jgi:type I restriction enzyme, S subunit
MRVSVDAILKEIYYSRCPTIIPEYLCEIARISNDYFKMIATAATVVYVNQSGFANMPILLPPKEEQEEIVNFTVLKTTKIDQQKVKDKEAIALLKEYRTALITNAVTGKIDVRTVPTPHHKKSLLEVCAILEETHEDFPDVDENLLPLDDIEL